MNNIKIAVESDIPVGKGMASSTADIAGIFFGLSKYYKIEISPELMAKLCVEIEPTDSIIFKEISLFDHINGDLVENYDWNLNFKVLGLEPETKIDTVEFRKYKGKQLKSKNQNSRALEKFKKAYVEKSYYKLGEATLESAMENQDILEKPYMDQILKIIEKNHCYGLNVAHSGTVVGIMYDDFKVDFEKLIYNLKENGILGYYNKQYRFDIISGGPQML